MLGDCMGTIRVLVVVYITSELSFDRVRETFRNSSSTVTVLKARNEATNISSAYIWCGIVIQSTNMIHQCERLTVVMCVKFYTNCDFGDNFKYQTFHRFKYKKNTFLNWINNWKVKWNSISAWFRCNMPNGLTKTSSRRASFSRLTKLR